MKTESAVFGGGCFWCTEAVFKMVKGVISVTPGYAGGFDKLTTSGFDKLTTGGSIKHPTYEDVCAGTTGHAEVVRITYDPSVVTYRDLLTVFFTTHDPTTPNQQGPDVGMQYRSLILFADEAQRREALAYIAELNTTGGPPLVTDVKSLTAFYEAEISHRDYYSRNREKVYCQLVIDPKLQKLQEKLPALLRN